MLKKFFFSLFFLSTIIFVKSQTIFTDKDVYNRGETVFITATSPNETQKDWIALYVNELESPITTKYLYWYYVADYDNQPVDITTTHLNTSGIGYPDYIDLPIGKYTIFLLEKDAYNILASKVIEVRSHYSPEEIPAAQNIDYQRFTTEVGFAYGEISVDFSNEMKPEEFHVYYANDEGKISGYDPIIIDYQGNNSSLILNEATLFPQGATKMQVYTYIDFTESVDFVETSLPAGAADYDLGTAQFEFQVLADPHVQSGPSINNSRFQNALTQINTISPQSSLLCVNGDIADSNISYSYVAYRNLLAAAGFPTAEKTFSTMGFNDYNNSVMDSFGIHRFLDSLGLSSTLGITTPYYDIWKDGYHFIFLSSENAATMVDGHLCATLTDGQINFFKKALAENRNVNRPTFVFLAQGLANTIEGTLEDQDFRGLSAETDSQLRAILKDYPEVVMFNAYSHADMNSINNFYNATDSLPNIFNGSTSQKQGYFVYIYDENIVVKGYNFITKQWIPAAYYSFQITGAYDIYTDRHYFRKDLPIKVCASSSDLDCWVGIFNKGVEMIKENSLFYYDLNDETQGKSIVLEGSYDLGEYIIGIISNEDEALKIIDIEVISNEEDKLFIKSQYYPNEEIIVAASSENSSTKDWVALYPGDLEEPIQYQYLYWYYVEKASSEHTAEYNHVDGELVNIKNSKASEKSVYFNDFKDLPSGTYTLFLLGYDVYTILDRTTFEIMSYPAPDSAVYERTAEVNGFADGTITIFNNKDVRPEYYYIYWGNADGPLKDYRCLPPVASTGSISYFDFPASVLIPKEADRLLVYSEQAIVPTANHIEIPFPSYYNDYDLGTPLTNIQVCSDIHISSSLNAISCTHFAATLKAINEISPDHRHLLVNGDISNTNNILEFEIYRKLCDSLGFEPGKDVICSIGNHDMATQSDGLTSEGRINKFIEQTGQQALMTQDLPYFDEVIDGVRFIALGTQDQGVLASFHEDEYEFLIDKLNEDRDTTLPTFVFNHEGMINSVAGCFEYQQWYGITGDTYNRLAEIFADYPEAVMFAGHSHWTMDSYMNYRPRGGDYPHYFNTAATAYLWDDRDISLTGAEIFFFEIYKNYFVARGYDVVAQKWIPSSQFFVRIAEDEHVSLSDDRFAANMLDIKVSKEEVIIDNLRENSVLEMFDLFGRKVYSDVVRDVEHHISRSDFPSGLYILKSSDGQSGKVVF